MGLNFTSSEEERLLQLNGSLDAAGGLELAVVSRRLGILRVKGLKSIAFPQKRESAWFDHRGTEGRHKVAFWLCGCWRGTLVQTEVHLNHHFTNGRALAGVCIFVQLLAWSKLHIHFAEEGTKPVAMALFQRNLRITGLE